MRRPLRPCWRPCLTEMYLYEPDLAKKYRDATAAARDEWTAEVLGAPHAGNLSRCAVRTTKIVIESPCS
eukprot:SAG25_NODE_21_length_22373_cov_13.904373_25_plen_69_part_00